MHVVQNSFPADMTLCQCVITPKEATVHAFQSMGSQAIIGRNFPSNVGHPTTVESFSCSYTGKCGQDVSANFVLPFGHTIAINSVTVRQN